MISTYCPYPIKHSSACVGSIAITFTSIDSVSSIAVPICAGPKLPPETKPAVVEIGKERGSAETANQRADAASS
jgi:hypothetical protein